MNPIKERHYKRVPALVRRDQGDQNKELFKLDLSNRLSAFDFLHAAPPPVRPANPSLMPSADGPITKILLTIPNYAVQDETMAAAYKSLLAALPKDTNLVVLVQESAKITVDDWLSAAGKNGQSNVDTFDDTLNISIWAEDGYVIAKDAASGATYFIEPYSFPRYADGLIGDFVAASPTLRTPVRLSIFKVTIH